VKESSAEDRENERRVGVGSDISGARMVFGLCVVFGGYKRWSW